MSLVESSKVVYGHPSTKTLVIKLCISDLVSINPHSSFKVVSNLIESTLGWSLGISADAFAKLTAGIF